MEKKDADPFSYSNSDSESDYSQFERFPIESTDIFMVSPPESFEQEDDSTPQNPLDLGRDTDLGFFESHLTEKHEMDPLDESIRTIVVCGSEVSASEAKEAEISSDGFCCEARLKESPSKKLKLSVESSVSEVAKSPVKPVPVISSDRKDEMAVESKAVNRDEQGKEKFSILKVLEILKRIDEGSDSEEDERLSKMSILEIAKSRGLTFPRPSWWPEGGFGGGKD